MKQILEHIFWSGQFDVIINRKLPRTIIPDGDVFGAITNKVQNATKRNSKPQAIK